MTKYFKTTYTSPIGEISICGNDSFITELFFSDTKISILPIKDDLNSFKETKEWLDSYFNGNKQAKPPSFKLNDLSSFQLDVLKETLKIGWGETKTYGDIAKAIASKRGIKRMSAQAVGHALNRNPICLIIPCHRVIGKNGKLIGYGAGIERKRYLLELES